MAQKPHNPDDEFNPAEQWSAEQLAAHEKAALNHIGANKSSKGSGGENAADTVRNGEEDSNQFKYNPQEYRDRKKRHKGVVKEISKELFKGPLGKNKGASLVIGALLMFIVGSMPFIASIMKLDVFLEPVIEKMSQIPEYAVEQRVEYMVTRWITMMAMKEAYPGDDNIVFCKGGGLLCHLGSTKYSAWFTKKLDAKFEKHGRGVKVVLNATGKTGLGGHATEFSLSLENIGDKDVGKTSHTVSRQLKGHKEARRVINQMVKQAHGRNYVLRFISKKILMRKYGVKRFNILPDETSKNIAEKKSKIKASILKSTVGKLSPRIAAYIGCFQGKDTLDCKRTLDSLGGDIDQKIQEAQDDVDKAPEGSDERKEAEERLRRAQSKKASIGGAKEAVEEAAQSTGKKISQTIMQKVVGRLAAAGLLDFVFGIVGLIDDRLIEAIYFDLMSQNAVGGAFNEDGSPIVAKDQVKLGKISLETLGIFSDMYNGAEKSPFFGLFYDSKAIFAKDAVTRPCTVDGKEVLVKLSPGETICPEKKTLRDFTKLKQNPWWNTLATVAQAWNSSVGLIFDAVDSVTSIITGPLWDLVTKLPRVDIALETLQKIIEDFVAGIFNVPELGPDAKGEDNFEQHAAALQIANNSSMESGQNSENQAGPANGAGGAKMSDGEIVMVINEKEQQRRDEFEHQTMFAKLFNPSLYGSVANRVIATTMMRSSSSLQLLLSTPGSILAGLAPRPAAAQSAQIELMKLKAFGMPTYGYADKATFEVDPATYTPEFCAASAAAREESLSLDSDDLIHTYKKTDPCALEKVVGGMLATAADDTENPLYVKEVGNLPEGSDETTEDGGATGSPGTGSENPGDTQIIDTPSRDGWGLPTNSKRVSLGWHQRGSKGVHKGIDFPGPKGTPVVAAHDGVVTKQYDSGACGWITVISATGVNGIWHAYQHADPVPGVRVGTTVKRGQLIARIGKFCGSGTHLHFSIETANRVSTYKDSGSSDTSRDPKGYIPL